jgi:hypothetical protein
MGINHFAYKAFFSSHQEEAGCTFTWIFCLVGQSHFGIFQLSFFSYRSVTHGAQREFLKHIQTISPYEAQQNYFGHGHGDA